MKKTAVALLVGIAMFVGSGCSLLDGPETKDVAAYLIYAHDTGTIAAPDSVARGQPFEIRVTTFGGGCIHSVARTEVRISGSVADVRPINRAAADPDLVCTRELRFIEHRATITIQASGPATIRAIGAQPGPTLVGADVQAILERSVIVR